MINSIYLSLIREFEPFENEETKHISVFKNTIQKNRDLLITISIYGKVRVWDMASFDEASHKFKLIQDFTYYSLED